MKNLLKRIRIVIVHNIREFLGINRDWDRVQADLKAIMEKELDRDEQYPLADKLAMPMDTEEHVVDDVPGMFNEAHVLVKFRDGQERHYTIVADKIDSLKKHGKIVNLRFCHPAHGEMMLVSMEDK